VDRDQQNAHFGKNRELFPLFFEHTMPPKAKPLSFRAKGPSFNFGANKKAAKPRKKTGPRPGKGPGGFTVMYGS
jgi:hypothetical protein